MAGQLKVFTGVLGSSFNYQLPFRYPVGMGNFCKHICFRAIPTRVQYVALVSEPTR